jgi:hypothetical protein
MVSTCHPFFTVLPALYRNEANYTQQVARPFIQSRLTVKKLYHYDSEYSSSTLR